MYWSVWPCLRAAALRAPWRSTRRTAQTSSTQGGRVTDKSRVPDARGRQTLTTTHTSQVKRGVLGSFWVHSGSQKPKYCRMTPRFVARLLFSRNLYLLYFSFPTDFFVKRKRPADRKSNDMSACHLSKSPIPVEQTPRKRIR